MPEDFWDGAATDYKTSRKMSDHDVSGKSQLKPKVNVVQHSGFGLGPKGHYIYSVRRELKECVWLENVHSADIFFI